MHFLSPRRSRQTMMDDGGPRSIQGQSEDTATDITTTNCVRGCLKVIVDATLSLSLILL